MRRLLSFCSAHPVALGVIAVAVTFLAYVASQIYTGCEDGGGAFCDAASIAWFPLMAITLMVWVLCICGLVARLMTRLRRR